MQRVEVFGSTAPSLELASLVQLLLRVSSGSLASATARAHWCMVSCCGMDLKARGLHLQAARHAGEHGWAAMPLLRGSMTFMPKGQGLVGGHGLGSQTSTPSCGKTAKVLRVEICYYCSALGELPNAVSTVSKLPREG